MIHRQRKATYWASSSALAVAVSGEHFIVVSVLASRSVQETSLTVRARSWTLLIR